jgi:hypothetical protein
MKHALRKLILGFLLLWLPLQGFAAAGMSFCRHDHTPPAAMQSADHQNHHQDHDCCPQSDTDTGSSQNLCDDCGYCHLGAAPALLPAAVALHDEARFSFKFSFDTTFPLFYPEQPQRPPHQLFS